MRRGTIEGPAKEPHHSMAMTAKYWLKHEAPYGLLIPQTFRCWLISTCNHFRGKLIYYLKNMTYPSLFFENMLH